MLPDNEISDNQISELARQLKCRSLPGVVDSVDPAAVWPVLVAESALLCLSDTARRELKIQPQTVTVIEGASNALDIAGVCDQYQHFHHVRASHANFSIIVAYQCSCVGLLSRLYGNASTGDFVSNHLYNFSLGIARSLVTTNRSTPGYQSVGFQSMEFSGNEVLSDAWHIELNHDSDNAIFLIGFLPDS